MYWKRLVVLSAVAAALTSAVSRAESLPLMWGVDEDDGQLFSIGDYTDPFATFTDFGRLQWDDHGRLRNIGAHIEAFTLDLDGTAYMARNRTFAGVHEPVFMSLNVNDAHTAESGQPNVVDILGRIDVPFDSGSDNITGLAFHPVTRELYVLFRDDKSRDADRLIIIDKSDGSLLLDLGRIEGLGERVGSGEDLAFDAHGNLYVTDNEDDELYQVDPLTAAIIDVIDDDERGGFGGSVKFEGLAWDFLNDRLIATDDKQELLAHLTLRDGENFGFADTSSLGLTDVEGIAFIPEPVSLSLLALGALALLRRRSRVES